LLLWQKYFIPEDSFFQDMYENSQVSFRVMDLDQLSSNLKVVVVVVVVVVGHVYTLVDTALWKAPQFHKIITF